MQITNHDEYETLVDELARQACHLGEDARTAANSAIIGSENLGDEKALTFNPEPFNTGDGERIWPKDVLTNDDRYPYDPEMGDDLRSLAVDSLTVDIDARMRDLREKYRQFLENVHTESAPPFERWVYSEVINYELIA